MTTLQKATQIGTKQHNKRLVLRVIYDQGEISRAEIARITHLTRTTVSNVVTGLMAEGLVAEIGQGPSAGGKPPTLLHVVDDARQIIGIDLANRELQGGVFDLRGRMQHHVSVTADRRNGEALLAQVYDLIEQLQALADRPLLGIGVGTPGLMNVDEGFIYDAIHLNWHDLPLRDLLQSRYNLPIYAVNDSQAAALAQFLFDNPQKATSLIVIKAGQGTSAGIVLNRRLFFGSNHSGASEIGHLQVVEGGEPCVCGHFGCLETVASSRALIRWARSVATVNPASQLNQFVGAPEEITTETLLLAFQAGDPDLNRAIVRAGRYLGTAVANLVTAFNIPLVYIAGSLSRFGDALLDPIRAEMHQRAYVRLAETTQIEISRLGQDIVMLGAASLLLMNELGVV
ncbi:MAG: ROK family transcriptional regulator [Chloroflexi bacterium]|nr:ROK family transcriptional regulator [Chloroflexota bacterium]